MAYKHGRCRVLFPLMEEYRKQLVGRDRDSYKCIRARNHTGMHQYKNKNGQRTEWTGGQR